MPSTYTQNLGIELPATGEQANTWGLTVNRNMSTIDIAINGNTQITLSSSAYLLSTTPGSANPVGAYPFIIWTGPQSAQGTVTIDPNTNQHLYLMSNRTTGNFPLAFRQGNGTQFVLQPGYDALIYADGGGTGANVAEALANPQFGNVLVQGNFALQGSVNGNLNLIGSLGVGNVSAIPDALTVGGTGSGGMGQLRLVEGNYGVIFRNDGISLYLLISTTGNPYGSWGPETFQVDLASGVMGIGVGASTSYNLNTGSFHAGSVAVDSALSAGGAASVGGGLTVANGLNVASGNVSMAGTLTVAGGLDVTAGHSYFSSGDTLQVGLYYGWGGPLTYIGTNASGQFVVSNSGGAALLTVDASGNAYATAGLQAHGLIHSTSGGIQFPDNTIQITAATTPPAYSPTPHFPARSTGTIYTNNYGVLLMVGVVIWLNAGQGAQAQIGPGGTTPNIAAAANNTASGTFWGFLFFMVPPGWSYQIWYSGGGGFPINDVTEYY